MIGWLVGWRLGGWLGGWEGWVLVGWLGGWVGAVGCTEDLRQEMRGAQPRVRVLLRYCSATGDVGEAPLHSRPVALRWSRRAQLTRADTIRASKPRMPG